MFKRRRRTQMVALGMALVGYWLPWLTHPAAALRMNGYELSEWVTFLPGVRDGTLPLSRLTFLLPLACLALLLALAAVPSEATAVAPLLATGVRTASLRRRTGLPALMPPVAGLGGRLLLLLGVACALVVFPPYPYLLTAFAEPEYRLQLFVAILAIVALVGVLYLPGQIKAALQVILAAAGGGLGLWSLAAVRPAAAALLGAPWMIGLGWMLMLAGFAGLAWVGLAQLLGQRT